MLKACNTKNGLFVIKLWEIINCTRTLLLLSITQFIISMCTYRHQRVCHRQRTLCLQVHERARFVLLQLSERTVRVGCRWLLVHRWVVMWHYHYDVMTVFAYTTHILCCLQINCLCFGLFNSRRTGFLYLYSLWRIRTIPITLNSTLTVDKP